jgi:hypothetical protein
MAVLNNGVQSSLDVLSTEQMPDNDRLLYLLYRHQFPLFQKMYFSTGKASKPVVNSAGIYYWHEDELYPSSTAISGLTGGAATEDVEDNITTAFIMPNDIVLVESTLQLLYCTTITGHTTLSTMDGAALITASGATYLRKVGTLDHEFAGARSAVATKPVQNSNYLTKFSESVAFSGRQDAGETWTDGTDFKAQVEKKIWEMKEFYENNFTFSTEAGTKTISATSSGYTQNFRATYGKGALGSITTNVLGYVTPNEDYWDSFFSTLFNTGGSRHKTLYFGTALGNNLAKIIKQKYAIDPKPIVTEYGVNLVRWTAFGGTVDLTWDVILDNTFTDWGFVIDHEGTGKGKPVTFRYMKDDSHGSRKFRIIENVQTKDIDGRIDVLRADIGVMYPNESIHGISRPQG